MWKWSQSTYWSNLYLYMLCIHPSKLWLIPSATSATHYYGLDKPPLGLRYNHRRFQYPRHLLGFSIRPTTFRQRYLWYFLLSKPPTTPTHVCGNILDILATNSPDRLRNVIVEDKNKFCRSDHYFISFDTAIRHAPARPMGSRTILLYSRADFTSIDNSIANYLHTSPRPASIDTLWSTIKDAILSACQLYVPTISIPKILAIVLEVP